MIPALIVPVLNRPDLLTRMVASIDEPVANLLVIDNGRCVDRVDFPAVRLHVLRMPSNLGVAASWNLGIKALPFAPWWLVVNSDAWFPKGSLSRFAREADQSVLTLASAAPPWACFALGDEVVRRVGLFDEALYPAYMEDTDYQRRCEHAGVEVRQGTIPVHHDNSSTLASDALYRSRNDATFGANADYYRAKQAAGDYSEGRWSLAVRRANSWD